MTQALTVLAVNPGSTSTKIALFRGREQIMKENVVHDAQKLAFYPLVSDQLDYRVETILEACRRAGVELSQCDAFVGRGGGLNPCEGGTYRVNETMLSHARRGGGNHPAALGSQIAWRFAREYGRPAFVVNPPDVDEYCGEARVTGLAGVYRVASTHALNQKETAIRMADELGKPYEACNLIICHLGGGVSVTAHHKGKMVDSNGIINGEGPMAPTRSGALPATEVIKLCFSGRYTQQELLQRVVKSGGFVDHLGTSEVLEILDKIEQGDQYAALIYRAFQYQVAKEAGAMAAVLCGEVDAIVLTGGIARDEGLCQNLVRMIGFIAPVRVFPGEFEMEALAFGAQRVLSGREAEKNYTGEPVFSAFSR